MDFVKQYLKVINYVMMGIIFAFASFYILSNAYHYLEIRKDFVTNFNEQTLTLNLEKTLTNTEKNIESFSTTTYHGTIPVNQMQDTYYRLKSCVASFRNDTIQSMKDKQKITIIDVYRLRESYENDILGNCIVNNLYWLTTITPNSFPSSYLLNNRDVFQLHINSLLDETTYLKKDLINNSSYFYNTSIASSSIKDNTKDGFYEVMGAYNKAVDFVELVSNWFKNEVEGNYD